MSVRRAWRSGGLAVWVGALLAAVGGSWRRGVLAGPPLGEPASWPAWAAGRSGLEAAFAVLALVVVILASYLLATTALAVVARLAGSRRMLSLAEVLTLPVVRRSLFAGLGMSLAGVAVVGAGSRPGGPGSRALALDAPGLVVVTTDPASGQAPTSPSSGEQAPVMQRLPDRQPDWGQPSRSTPESPPPESPPPASPPPEWEVRSGDHLWSVAARILEAARKAEVTDAEMAPYWRSVVEANRSLLADPANPDLIFAGQRLVIPAPPSR